jgi:hypothetical protein
MSPAELFSRPKRGTWLPGAAGGQKHDPFPRGFIPRAFSFSGYFL